MSELKINLEKLKRKALVWKEKHAAIESIWFVHADDYLQADHYYKAILIALVPKPDDDYLDWADNAGASHIRDEVESLGLADVMWLTCDDMAEAKDWVADLTKFKIIRDKGEGSSISIGLTSSITSAGRTEIKTPPFDKSRERLEPINVRAPSITSAEGANIVWEKLTEIPEKYEARHEAVSSAKNRSRSSEDRELSITLAKQFIDQHQTKKKPYTLNEATIYIQPKLTKKWLPRTIKGWIKLHFTDEAKKPGRPPQKKDK